MSTLIHARMITKLQKNFFPQVCALKKPMPAQDGVGEEIVQYQVHTGYDEIACRVSAARGGQRRGSQATYIEATHQIVLAGIYEDLPSAWREGEEWIAEVDNVEYKIMLVATSAEKVLTHLETRIISGEGNV